MPGKAPSLALLRRLATATLEPVKLRPAPSQSKQICLSCQHRLSFSRPNNHHLRQPTRHFTVSSSSPSSDPSTTTSSADDTPSSLPDISNHYTIFPQTLPHGPPNSPPSSSSSSSTSSSPTSKSPFLIPLAPLRREFLHLQSLFHPDKFPPAQKTKAEALSSRINTAYKTLMDPLLRAQYLLDEFHGIDVLAEDQGAKDQDPETLMEVMEAQEAIEEASEEAEIEGLKTVNRARIDETVKKLGQAFDGGEIEEARKECIKLRFWRSLQEGLDSWEPGKEVRLIH